MLSSIHIENIALIERLDISFSGGFSAFTGETGAGKSIVVDAIGMACGAKISKEIIRRGEQEARVEALFCDISEESLKKCEALGVYPDEDGCYFVTRTLNIDGKSTAKVNGRQIPLSLLREFSSEFINIHGQHDNASLLRSEKHLSILDAFADNEAILKNYRDAYAQYNSIRNEIDALSIDEKEKKRQSDILKFQIEEIRSAKLKKGEEEKLVAEKNKLRHSEKITTGSISCYKYLLEGVGALSAVDCVEKAKNAISSLSGIVESADSLTDRLDSVKYELIDIAEIANDLAGDIDEDPTKALDIIESRLDLISRLCSRYGADVSEVLAFCEECEKKLSDIEYSDVKIAELNKQLSKCREELLMFAERLTDSRRKAAVKLSKSIENELQYLDMKNARFEVGFEKSAYFNAEGCDVVEFLISTNNGEGFNSLSKTGSGGELSRIMLAMKTVLSSKDGVETMIFDEIDTGISGSTSRRIGMKLKSLAMQKQVLCVTHSAQVASLADCHYKVAKTSKDDRTTTFVKALDYDDRVLEIARIISGMDISEASIASAKELIDNFEDN